MWQLIKCNMICYFFNPITAWFNSYAFFGWNNFFPTLLWLTSERYQCLAHMPLPITYHRCHFIYYFYLYIFSISFFCCPIHDVIVVFICISFDLWTRCSQSVLLVSVVYIVLSNFFLLIEPIYIHLTANRFSFSMNKVEIKHSISFLFQAVTQTSLANYHWDVAF